jgi:DNA polymerase III sliding clamp (beta) subunit (PCNA family)
MKTKDYKSKLRTLKSKKREVMKEDFESSKERRSIVDSFKRESRSLKRSEKNSLRRQLRDDGIL